MQSRLVSGVVNNPVRKAPRTLSGPALTASGRWRSEHDCGGRSSRGPVQFLSGAESLYNFDDTFDHILPACILWVPQRNGLSVFG